MSDMQPVHRTPWRDVAIHALLLAVIVACAFPGVFLRGEMASPGDILFAIQPWSHYAPPGWQAPQNRLMVDIVTAFVAYRSVTQFALADGEWPLWNPYQFTGMPLLANCQSAILYPPTLLYGFLNVHVADTVCILLKLWIAGMAAFVCGRGLKLSLPAARFLSIAWMLSSLNLVWCYWGIPDVCAWFPIAFLGAEYILNGNHRRGFFATLVGGTLMFLAGHPESVAALGLGLAAYVFLRLAWKWRIGEPVVIAGAVWAAAWVLAVAVAAGQLIPFLEYLQHSYQGPGSHNAGAKPGYPMSSIAAFWLPRFFGLDAQDNYWGNLDSNRQGMVYAGIPAWLGMALLLARRPSGRTERMRVLCLGAAAVITILLAFEVWPLNVLFKLPLLNAMKVTYLIEFAMFALPLLAAIGLDRWLEGAPRVRDLAWPVLAGALAAGAVYFVYRFHAKLIEMMHMTPYVGREAALAAGLALATLLVLFIAAVTRRKRLTWALLTVLLAVDLLAAARGLNPTLPRERLFPKTELTSFLAAQPKPCRFGLSEGPIPSGMATIYGIEDLIGYDGLYPDRIMTFMHALKTDVWKAIEPVYGVQFYLNAPEVNALHDVADTTRFEKVTTLDGIDVYRNKRALPRAFLVGKLRLVEDAGEMFGLMSRGETDPAREALVERMPENAPPETQTGHLGTCEITRWTTNSVAVSVEATAPGTLVLSDQYYPGWEARIDGQRGEIFPVWRVFRGVVVPEGQHTVEFTYRPATFALGIGLSVAGIVTSLAVAFFTRTRDGIRRR